MVLKQNSTLNFSLEFCLILKEMLTSIYTIHLSIPFLACVIMFNLFLLYTYINLKERFKNNSSLNPSNLNEEFNEKYL